MAGARPRGRRGGGAFPEGADICVVCMIHECETFLSLTEEVGRSLIYLSYRALALVLSWGGNGDLLLLSRGAQEMYIPLGSSRLL